MSPTQANSSSRAANQTKHYFYSIACIDFLDFLHNKTETSALKYYVTKFKVMSLGYFNITIDIYSIYPLLSQIQS